MFMDCLRKYTAIDRLEFIKAGRDMNSKHSGFTCCIKVVSQRVPKYLHHDIETRYALQPEL